jgi:polyketide synthase 12
MHSEREGIAIVGIGCRLPGGVRSPEQLLEFVTERRSGIVTVPPDRWNAELFYHPDFKKPGFIHVKKGGFIEDVDRFDAAFFGISPNEARRMDPQQRLVLETSMRAIEDAGIPLEALAGSATAVFVGVSGHDYDSIQGAATERVHVTGATNTGSASSIVANRVSYLFDLRGPSMALDTACSSALYALHHACRAIWSGDATMALAGGVNLMLKPETTIGFSKGGYLSKDAECRAFSDDANGYVRGEGAGMALLKPVSAALRDGDRIWAVIRGSCVNQDGRTMGMTLPSEEAQVRLLSAAYADAGVDPAKVTYVEAHGTGTPAGDPIEARALGRVLGQVRTSGQLYIGSVKTNLGHLESAAGIAGLIKLALTLRHRRVLPNNNFRAPNPAIPFDALRMRVPTESVALDVDRSKPIFGGINSFGFGGANAHLVLESPPPAAPRQRSANAGPTALVLSARGPDALRAMAGDLADRLDRDDVPLDALARGLLHRRSGLELRLSHVATTRDAASDALRRFARAGSDPEVSTARVSADGGPKPLAFVFSGQGPQWWGMGRRLFATSTAYRATVEHIGRRLAAHGWLDGTTTLLKELLEDEAHSRMGETCIAQPALFALQMGVVAELAERGIVPGAVVGHSIGELAAAAVAGALTVDEAVRIVVHRSRAQSLAEGSGAMAALGVSASRARELCAAHHGKIELAADNGPNAVTVAGVGSAVDALVAELDARDVFARRIDVSVPFHCFLMDQVETPFRRGLGTVGAQRAELPFYSTVSGTRRDGSSLDLDYWFDNIREAVRFREAFEALVHDGFERFVEIGPHPILKRGADEVLRQAKSAGLVIPSLRRNADDGRALAETVATAFLHGVRAVAGTAAHVDDLPRHRLAAERFWMETPAGAQARKRGPTHPVVGELDGDAASTLRFRCPLVFDVAVERYLGEHVVQGVVVVPAAAQLEAVLAAATRAFPGEETFLEDVRFLAPIALPDQGDAPEHRLEVLSDDGSFELRSRTAGADFVLHTRGRINHGMDGFRADANADAGPETWRTSGRQLAPALLFDAAARAGLSLGPAFQGITELSLGPNETVARVVPPEVLRDELGRYQLHPALLDSIIQTAAFGPLSSSIGDGAGAGLFLPHRVQHLRIHRAPDEPFLCRARVVSRTADEIALDIRAVSDDGRPLVDIDGLVVRYVHGTRRDLSRSLHTVCYDEVWERAARGARDEGEGERERTTWLIVSDQGPIGSSLAARLRALGHRATETSPANALALADASVDGLIHLGALDVTDFDAKALDRVLEHGLGPLAELTSRLVEHRRGRAPLSVRVVTRGAWRVRPTDELGGSAAAALWGAARVISSEERRAEVSLLDLDGHTSPDELDQLLAEVLARDPDHEIALRGGERWVRRLRRLEPEDVERARAVEPQHHTFRALVRTPGVLGSVALRSCAPPEPPPGALRIQVRATGLNFKDVMVAMGMLPAEAWRGGLSGAELGMDCAGVVTAVGAGVHDLRVGDEVVALAPRCLGNVAIAKHEMVVRKPAGLSFEDAAALPTAYLTAEVALDEVGRTAPGETVLVHAAAGGVGCAAIQVARRLGARVIGTTSTEDKRAFLRSAGVATILNSRGLDFRRGVLEATGGRGADVVLNCLSGLGLLQSIKSLAAFGRFVEIGKADLYQNRQIGILPFAENGSYHALDINRWVVRFPQRTKALLQSIMDRIEQGSYAPLPVRTFAVEHAAEALAELSRGKQIGKLVVSVPSRGHVEVLPSPQLAISPEGSVLVTGGTSGLGLRLALRLAERGARDLVLVSRRGAVEPADEPHLATLRARGVHVDLRRCDVSDRGAVDALIADLRSRGRAVRSVFHAAMVLDDAPLASQSRERFARVVDPKARGAIHLHEATLGDELDHFVLFSSIAAVLGTPGQANYAAANAVLDALADHRRARGLPAMAVDFGVLVGAGVVERAGEAQRRKILGQGVRAFTIDEALDALERLLGATDGGRRVVADIDWSSVARLAPPGPRPLRFGDLQRAAGAERAADAGGASTRDEIFALPEPQRAPALAAWLAKHVAQVTGQTGALDVAVSLSRVGLDSLGGTQLITLVSTTFGVDLPLVRLLRGPSVAELATDILSLVARRGRRDEFSWVRVERPAPRARFRLFCVPPMAACGEAFAAWERELPDDIELCTLERPELGGPMHELLVGPIEDLRAAMVDALQPLLDRPYGFYGHSMGGWIALDLAEALAERGCPPPAFMALGALPTAETMRAAIPSGLGSPDEIGDEHLAEVARSFSVPPAALGGADVLSRMRRDVWLGVQSGRFGDGARWTAPKAPLLLVGATHDEVPTVDRGGTPSIDGVLPQAVCAVPGGHLFHQEPEGRSQAVKQLVGWIDRFGEAR